MERALAYLADRSAASRLLGRSPQPLSAAEIGTGSGALAVSLAAESSGTPLRLVATDISGDALAVARANALRQGVGARIGFLHGDLAEPLLASRAPGDPPHLDLLLANLPYVPSDDIDAARAAASFQAGSGRRDQSVVGIAAEPRRALDGGADGLELIRRLVAELPRLMRPAGAALLEFGDGQAAAVAQLVDGLGLGWRATIHADLSGRPRVAEVRRGG